MSPSLEARSRREADGQEPQLTNIEFGVSCLNESLFLLDQAVGIARGHSFIPSGVESISCHASVNVHSRSLTKKAPRQNPWVKKGLESGPSTGIKRAPVG